MDKYLIWWTSQADHERVTPLDNWPAYLAKEFRNRQGRAGRGRLWVSSWLEKAGDHPPDGVTVEWDADRNWLCRIAEDAGGIVIRTEHLHCVQFLPGFVTTFAMTLPDSNATAPI